ncbi:Thioredoxin [compost metagenome]
MSNLIKEVHSQQDIDDLYKAGNNVILKFGAPWCAPCKIVDKTLEEISDETDIVIAKVNVDDQPEIAGKYGVMSLPTIFIIEDGITVNRYIGVKAKSELISQF